jgi:hypothetical protein
MPIASTVRPSPDAACVHVVDPDAGQSGAERSLAALVA